MIDADVLLKILPIFALGAISPGPDFMVVSMTSLSRGRLEGVKAAAGIAIVTGLYTLIGLAGLAVLFNRYLWLTMIIKICGGLYLIYLGTKMWRASLKRVEIATSHSLPRQRNSYLMGALTCLTNPKAIAFFASVFALGLAPDTNFATKTALQAAVPLIAFCWFSFVAFGLSKPMVRNRYFRWQKAIDRMTGTVLSLFGIKLILSARS